MMNACFMACVEYSVRFFRSADALSSTWPHLNSDIGLEERLFN